MAKTFYHSGSISSTKKKGYENGSLYLLMLLLGMLVLFFVFWTPSVEPAFQKQALKGSEVTTSNKIERPDPATIYKAIVTDGDAIRSVLQ